jgi:hypothetical protein
MHLGRAFERFWLSAETASHRSQESIPISLSAVSGAPATQSCAVGESSGRFGYSDLKEAAHMEAYVL